MYISLLYLSSCSLDIIMGLFIENAWGRIGKIGSTAGEEWMTECETMLRAEEVVCEMGGGVCESVRAEAAGERC